MIFEGAENFKARMLNAKIIILFTKGSSKITFWFMLPRLEIPMHFIVRL